MASRFDYGTVALIGGGVIGAVAAAVTGLVYYYQKDLMYARYMPEGARTFMPRPSYWKIDADNWQPITLTTPDSETLECIFLPAPKNLSDIPPTSTILFMHGNAGNIAHRWPLLWRLAQATNSNVMGLGYRGFGTSSGDPDEDGLKVDAQTAFDWLVKSTLTGNTPIVIFGQSLGGAVAINLAATNLDHPRLAGLVVENSFISMRAMVPSMLGTFGKLVAPLCHQVWASDKMIGLVKVPTLFLAGLKDYIVPPAHMDQLYELSKSQVKIQKKFVDGEHNETFLEEGYMQAVDDFIRRFVARKRV